VGEPLRSSHVAGGRHRLAVLVFRTMTTTAMLTASLAIVAALISCGGELSPDAPNDGGSSDGLADGLADGLPDDAWMCIDPSGQDCQGAPFQHDFSRLLKIRRVGDLAIASSRS